MGRPAPKNTIEIVDYTDYVPFIQDLVRLKKAGSGFSYRIFCRKSGFRSPTYLKWVMDGVRPISLKSAGKFAAGLSLDKRETQYFILMVNYKEAPDPQTKRYYYEQLLAWRKRRVGPLTQDAYEYLSHWYYVALRELVASSDFEDDVRWIQDRLGGDLTVNEIKSGMETLARLNLIQKSHSGRWHQTTSDLHTEHEVVSLAGYNYHTEMLELAQKALHRCEAKDREYQSIVALIAPETLTALKSKLIKFQESIVEFIKQRETSLGNHHTQDALYAFNMQLLPLTSRQKEPR